MDNQLYDVWKQESHNSEWYVPICQRVSLAFAQWCEANPPMGLRRYYKVTQFEEVLT